VGLPVRRLRPTRRAEDGLENAVWRRGGHLDAGAATRWRRHPGIHQGA
jgi:hypothetical protein